MAKVFVLVKNRSRQYEALRTSLGMLLEDHEVSMIVLENEIEDFNEAYSDNLGFLVEMGGDHYSNNRSNVQKHAFQYLDIEGVGQMLKGSDVVLPF